MKQREEFIDKRSREQEKRDHDEKERKAAANKKILARIAYKEWKERKLEEDKLKKR